MTITLTFAGLTLIVIGAFFWAARAGRDVADRDASALAIYEDQLAELARDADRGVITEDERAAAEIEIKRRMLKAAEKQEIMPRASVTWPILVSAVLVPVGAVVIYMTLGRPDLPAAPFAERQAESQELRDLTERLRVALTNDESGGETRGWRLLAQTLNNQGRPAEALEAFRVILARDDANSVDYSLGAETAIVVNQGRATPEAKAWAERALELSPQNPAATFYLALAISQEGRNEDALKLLADRVAIEEGFTDWMPQFMEFGERLALATELPMFPTPAPRGPTAEDMMAAQDMSAEDRAAMIEGMVEGLASRLSENPEDVDGWLRLARAYSVLGRRDEAIAALEQVMARTEEDDPRRTEATEGLNALQ